MSSANRILEELNHESMAVIKVYNEILSGFAKAYCDETGLLPSQIKLVLRQKKDGSSSYFFKPLDKEDHKVGEET